MFDEEYVDPADSMCEECKDSFGVHLMTCSKFVDPKERWRKQEEEAGKS
jgi:hypothetical protein